MITLDDVAKHASVSPSTVSIVVNNRKVRGVSISSATRQRVLESARELGYTPNSLARAVATGKNRVFAYLTDNPTSEMSLRAMIGAQEEADKHDYMIKPFRWPTDQSLWQSTITKIIGQRVAGVVLISIEDDSLKFIVGEIARCRLPFVEIDDCKPQPIGTSVISDDESGIKQVVSAMVELGHRDFAYVGGPSSSRIAADRLSTVRAAIVSHDLPVHDDWIVPGNWAEPSVVRPIVAQIVSDPSRRPSALLCGSDWIAMMAFQSIRKAGLSVPGDISVVGFANMSGSYLTDPSLTTVSQPFEQMGTIAVRHLMDAEGMSNAGPSAVIKAPTEIIWRESTGYGPFRKLSA